MRRSLVVAGALALMGCSSALPPAGPGAPNEVSSIRLFDGAGIDRTGHLFLFRADTLHLEVRMYAYDGRYLTSITGGFELTLTFDPASIATVTPTPSDPLVYAVTTSAPVSTLGALTVSVRFLGDGSQRTFGPFECLVH